MEKIKKKQEKITKQQLSGKKINPFKVKASKSAISEREKEYKQSLKQEKINKNLESRAKEGKLKRSDFFSKETYEAYKKSLKKK